MAITYLPRPRHGVSFDVEDGVYFMWLNGYADCVVCGEDQPTIELILADLEARIGDRYILVETIKLAAMENATPEQRAELERRRFTGYHLKYAGSI